MAEQILEGSQPVDLQKHPSGIVPTLQFDPPSNCLEIGTASSLMVSLRHTQSIPRCQVGLPSVTNIVSTVNLDCKLDLKAIALQARNAEYNPKRFAAVIMRIREPKTTALIFASGKMVCIHSEVLYGMHMVIYVLILH
eukprot:Gb_31321 [translate_table: standard]